MIELNQLTAGYGKKCVLDKIDASFETGKLIAVIGTNGCGKSTLLKTVSGILSPMGGEILIDDRPLSNLSPRQSAQRIAYLQQSTPTLDMTVEELVLQGRFPHLSFPHVYAQKDRTIAADAMNRLGLLPLAKRELSTLSGGMRQHAHIAMALAQSADHILLDEPTTYLDIGNRLQLMRTLQALARDGKCVLTVLHDVSLAMEFADEIAVIENGHLAAYGTPESVFEKCLIDRIFGVRLSRVATQNGYSYYVSNQPC